MLQEMIVGSGERFTMKSGTSMSALDVAGIAALIKQKYPHLTHASIASAMSTIAFLSDRKRDHIMAQRTSLNPDISQSSATRFNMASGFINATAVLDPGLIFNIVVHQLYSSALSYPDN
ncbi:unnamed protein product [Cochlearia groenlandica]